MCTYMVNYFKQEIREKCVQANLDIGTIQGLEDVLSRQPPHPFEGVEVEVGNTSSIDRLDFTNRGFSAWDRVTAV